MKIAKLMASVICFILILASCYFVHINDFKTSSLLITITLLVTNIRMFSTEIQYRKLVKHRS